MGVDLDVERAIAAVQSGRAVLLPTDTVYGLATSVRREQDAVALYRLKGRIETQPTALLAGSVEGLLVCVPELAGDAEVIARTLLPGPYTLILPNPARRYPWITGIRTDTIGVRVPELHERARRVIDAVGCVLATSANESGGPSPASLDDVPARIREACAAEVDVGPLPGTASTVIDFTRDEPYVIRDGLGDAAVALERVRAALAS